MTRFRVPEGAETPTCCERCAWCNQPLNATEPASEPAPGSGTDARQMLGPWIENDGEWARALPPRFLPAQAFLRDATDPTSAAWKVWSPESYRAQPIGGRMPAAQGVARDLDSAKLAADTAARRWYRLSDDAHHDDDRLPADPDTAALARSRGALHPEDHE